MASDVYLLFNLEEFVGIVLQFSEVDWLLGVKSQFSRQLNATEALILGFNYSSPVTKI